MHRELFLIRNLLLMMILIVGLFIMKTLAGILLPLVMALLLSFLYLPVVLFLEKKRFPTGIIVAFIAVITLGAIAVVANIFISTINEIIGEQDFLINQLFEKFQAIASLLSRFPYFEIDENAILSGINNLLNRELITSTLGSFFKGAGSFGSSFLMFTLYFLFLLPGLSRYQHFLNYVGGDKAYLVDDYETIQRSVSTYILIKLIISLVTGSIAWLICVFTGLRFAFFWGFLTTVLNFIPSIGSIIATIIPSLFGIILFDSYQQMIILAILLGINQMIIGNVVDPRIMGNRLRLNTVTVLFGLVFWGVIWGIPGMLLSVPLSVILKLILEKSSSWSVLARIMGSPEPMSGRKREGIFGTKKKKEDEEESPSPRS